MTANFTAARVPANTVKVGDRIGTQRDDSRKFVTNAGHVVGRITASSNGRVQLRDAAGRMIRSSAPETLVWRATEVTTNPTETQEVTTMSATTDTPATTTETFDWPEKPAKLLAEYLKDRNAPQFDADAELRPYLNSTGKVFIHSTHWREWLTAKGLEPTKGQAAEPLRAAGLTVRATPIPGAGYSKGFYTGDAPKGAEKLPRRERVRAAGAPRGPRTPFGKLTDQQRALVYAGLANLSARALKDIGGDDPKAARDALLKHVEPVADEQTDAPAEAPAETPDAPAGK